jgi:peptide/nickel transport system permease protein
MSGFTGFALRRTVSAVLTLLALSVIIYVVFYATPGNVAQITCGPRCSPEQVHQVAQQLRLDDPLYLRYWHFLQGILVGQDYSTGTSVEHCSAPCLGQSYQGDQQVTQLILAKLPVSLSLVFGAMVLWLILGVGTGILSAWRRGRFGRRLIALRDAHGGA